MLGPDDDDDGWLQVPMRCRGERGSQYQELFLGKEKEALIASVNGFQAAHPYVEL